MSVDFKKTQKELYAPKAVPSVINVPEMGNVLNMLIQWNNPKNQ